MNFSTLPSNFSTDITTPWEFVRSVLLWFWEILTTDFIHYGNLSFSIFDVFFGFTILAIILRLVYMRMHLASAVGSVRDMKSASDERTREYYHNMDTYKHAQDPDFVGPFDLRR